MTPFAPDLENEIEPKQDYSSVKSKKLKFKTSNLPSVDLSQSKYSRNSVVPADAQDPQAFVKINQRQLEPTNTPMDEIIK